MFIQYEPSTVHPKGLVHARFLLDPDVVKNHDFQEIRKPFWNLRITRKHTPGPLEKTPDLRELRFHMARRAVVSRVIRCRGDMPSESDPSDRGVWSILDRFLNYLFSCTGSVHIFPTWNMFREFVWSKYHKCS